MWAKPPCQLVTYLIQSDWFWVVSVSPYVSRGNRVRGDLSGVLGGPRQREEWPTNQQSGETPVGMCSRLRHDFTGLWVGVP